MKSGPTMPPGLRNLYKTAAQSVPNLSTSCENYQLAILIKENHLANHRGPIESRLAKNHLMYSTFLPNPPKASPQIFVVTDWLPNPRDT